MTLAMAEALDAAGVDPAVVDGRRLFRDVTTFLARYVVFRNRHQATTVALWLFHTWAIDAFDATPYLHVTSPEKRCGKSRLLECIDLLAARSRRTASMSESALFRSIAGERITLLFDEIDATFGNGRENEALRALINAGSRRGSPVYRVVTEGRNQVVRSFESFCPKVLSGIDRGLPGTIADRCIRIDLQRKAPDQRVAAFRQRNAEAEAEPIRSAMDAWATVHLDELKSLRPDAPNCLNDRQADGWEPLLACADVLGVGDQAREAASSLSDVADDESLGVVLLEGLRDTFDRAGADRLPTSDLLDSLIEDVRGPWAEMWADAVHAGRTKGPASRLAKMLRPFGIRPTDIRFDYGVRKGYERVAFADAFSRYLSQKGDTGNNATTQVADAPDQPCRVVTTVASLDERETEDATEHATPLFEGTRP